MGWGFTEVPALSGALGWEVPPSSFQGRSSRPRMRQSSELGSSHFGQNQKIQLRLQILPTASWLSDFLRGARLHPSHSSTFVTALRERCQKMLPSFSPCSQLASLLQKQKGGDLVIHAGPSPRQGPFTHTIWTCSFPLLFRNAHF